MNGPGATLSGRPDGLTAGGDWRLYGWPLLTGLVGLFCDLLTKDLATLVLAGRPPLELLPGVTLLHRVNLGLLLGVGGSWAPWLRRPLVIGLAVLALLLLPALVGWLVREPLLRAWALALLAAGALGNLLGRLWRDEVVDFLVLGPRGWPLPAFNLADLEIVFGTALVLYALFGHRLRRRGRSVVLEEE